ncbi:MAG: UvrD-helicase domain-containing protein [Myxococcaceae bacterium]
MKLNPPQQQAVVTTEGPLLVLAGAGSGKTRVIIHRIAHLLAKGVPASSILAVTFTNKAAAEMKERAKKMSGKKADKLTLSTFHAFGAEVLREHVQKLGWPKKFAICDMSDQLGLIKRAMRERKIDDRAFDARKVLSLISKAKNNFQVPQPKPEGMGDDYDLITAEVYPLYQLGLKAAGSVDFDDLLLFPVRLFDEHPKIQEAYQKRFRYLMVDEYQDTNSAQLELLKRLAGEKANVAVVGDDDQCIYSWRGAQVRNILDFERHFPNAKVVALEQNYRSTEVILEAANAVIAKNPERRAKRLWTQMPGGSKITVVVAPNEEEEAKLVAFEIRKAIDAGILPQEIAVLYRTNGQSRPVEESLRAKEISYEVVGGSEFFEKREVKDVLAYLKAIVNPNDEVSLLRIVNVPSRGIGDVTLERLQVEAAARGHGIWETMKAAATVPDLPNGAAVAVEHFCALMTRYRGMYSKGNLAEVTHKLLEEIDFKRAAQASGGSPELVSRRLAAVDSLLQSLKAYESREGRRTDLFNYLQRLSLEGKDDEENEQPKGAQVTLMTLHSAKGLEWRLVFLIGMEEDLLPHGGMQGEPPNPEEERRLCYVGITRAREKLFLTRAAIRVKRGKELPRTPSRFLADVPEALCEVIDLVTPAGPVTEKEQNFFGSLRERLAAKKASGAPPS